MRGEALGIGDKREEGLGVRSRAQGVISPDLLFFLVS